MSSIPFEVLMAFDTLQSRYVAALDKQEMDGWLATFCTDEASSYICNTAENVEAGFKIAWILDDCRARLHDRVTFVDKVWAGTYTVHRTRHVTQRTSWAALESGDFSFESNFIVTYSSPEVRRTEILATGVYQDVVRLEAGELKFVRKQVVVDGDVLNRYLVFPL